MSILDLYKCTKDEQSIRVYMGFEAYREKDYIAYEDITWIPEQYLDCQILRLYPAYEDQILYFDVVVAENAW